MIGLREEKKSERLMRIKEAARALFLKKGYDRTTLRNIGTRAGIPAVTILRYVEDKRDLLYLLFNEDHAKVTEIAVQDMSETRSFLEESIAGFRHYYRYFAARPDFARCILREVTFIVRRPGNHAFEASNRNLNRIKRTVEIARARGEIRHPAPDEEIARLIFELYQIETRRWLLATKPDIETGLKSLRDSLAIIMEGLSGGPTARAQPAARSGRSRSTKK
jgi:AcrR family transcriptional regulator